jgi:hypothetical protein
MIDERIIALTQGPGLGIQKPIILKEMAINVFHQSFYPIIGMLAQTL